MTTQSIDQTQLKLNVDEAAGKPFVEPEILGSLDVLESTSFFQVTTGAPDITVDISP